MSDRSGTFVFAFKPFAGLDTDYVATSPMGASPPVVRLLTSARHVGIRLPDTAANSLSLAHVALKVGDETHDLRRVKAHLEASHP